MRCFSMSSNMDSKKTVQKHPLKRLQKAVEHGGLLKWFSWRYAISQCHRHATLSFYMGFVNINTISCYQLLIWFPFLGLLPPDLLLFVVLCKCFLASLGFFIFLSRLYYFRVLFFFDMEIHEKNNVTKGFLVTHGTLWSHALNEEVSRWYVG